MTKFHYECRRMTEVISLNEWKKISELDIFVKDLREYVWEVREETHDIPDYGKKHFWRWKR